MLCHDCHVHLNPLSGAQRRHRHQEGLLGGISSDGSSGLTWLKIDLGHGSAVAGHVPAAAQPRQAIHEAGLW